MDRYPGVIERSGGPNEIWKFSEENYEIIKDIIKDIIHLRERLKPYIIKHMDIASATGTPFMRPMFYDFYDDETCYKLEDQYMFGEDILFAPIMERRQTVRKVYLPKGRWVNVNDHEVYEGGQWIESSAPINQFIAFVKEGKEVLTYF